MVIPALERWRQKDHELDLSALNFVERNGDRESERASKKEKNLNLRNEGNPAESSQLTWFADPKAPPTR